MTDQTKNAIHFTAPRGHWVRDIAVVTFLVVVLGAFVAQIVSSSSGKNASPPTASAAVTTLSLA
ncbi:MAG TPA: hypothetical protein VMT17_14455 [Anaeromyxobacteraceae bacterium]|nr:hypothetical protein [Anaeromyxobacteraceae bacterium]